MIKIIGIAKERESPENPGALEQRVALIPKDVKQLIDFGCDVFVEEAAGEGIGFTDREYEKAGAVIESSTDIYAGKDMVIKFKGPAMEDIPLMKPGTILFCMAHFHSFPERAALLEKHNINVVAMEQITESPEKVSDDTIAGRMAVFHCMEPIIRRNLVPVTDVGVLGMDAKMQHVIRRLGDYNTKTLRLFQDNVHVDAFEHLGQNALYVYNSADFDIPDYTLNYLRDKKCTLFDIHNFERNYKKKALEYYRSFSPPSQFGMRRIQCLHETGMAGARYGLKLLREDSVETKKADEAVVSVLGYGNVGMGAIDECYRQKVPIIHILGRMNTHKDKITPFLEEANLVVNGAEQPVELRGKNYLVTNEHVKNVLKNGSVVIDLIGGSATNRSPVEPVVECTYLTDPHFEQDSVLISALWGWPMMGMMRETAIRYSGQIIDVLLNEEKLIEGINDLPPGVKPALVCGPF